MEAHRNEVEASNKPDAANRAMTPLIHISHLWRPVADLGRWPRMRQKRVKPKICPKRGWRLGRVGTFGVVACVREVTVTPGELLADADLIDYTMGASEKDEEEAIRKAVDFSTTARRQIGPACLARLASGKGNWDQPNHTTGSGLPPSKTPTYSAFWSVFGVTCLRMQRLASSVGFGATARLEPRRNLPDSDVSSEPEGCYATSDQLFASLLHTAFAAG